MGDEVAQAPPFLIRSLLQAPVMLPVGGEGDPLRFATKQIHSGSRG
jgi:hypothetical protein